MSKPKSQDKPEALTADEVIVLAQQTGEILEGVIDAQSYQRKGEPDDVAI